MATMQKMLRIQLLTRIIHHGARRHGEALVNRTYDQNRSPFLLQVARSHKVILLYSP